MIKLPDLCSRVVNRGSFPLQSLSQRDNFAVNAMAQFYGACHIIFGVRRNCVWIITKVFSSLRRALALPMLSSLIVALVRQTWKLPCVSWFQSTLDVHIMWHIRKTTTQKKERKKLPLEGSENLSATHMLIIYYLLVIRRKFITLAIKFFSFLRAFINRPWAH